MIQCGKSIDVKTPEGSFAVRYIAQCGGRFLTVSNSWQQHRNGFLLTDWRSVARELVALTVPASLRYEKGMAACSQVDGMYNDLMLTYPLSINGMAVLLGEDAAAVGELLSDLAVQAE